MLNIQDVKLKQNLVIVKEHPVAVTETIGGVMKSPEQIAQDKARQLLRTGVIVAAGEVNELTNQALPTSLTKGKHIQATELIGTTIIYPASGVDYIFDLPLEDIDRPIVISLDYILGTLEVDNINR